MATIEERILLITAYYPDLARWEADYKTRRKKGGPDVLPMLQK
jgi:hypothetical protein